jgi:hypothetical protein
VHTLQGLQHVTNPPSAPKLAALSLSKLKDQSRQRSKKPAFSSSFDSQKLPLEPTVLATAMKGTATGAPYRLPANIFMKEDPGTMKTCRAITLHPHILVGRLLAAHSESCKLPT